MAGRGRFLTVFTHYFTNYYRSRSFYVMLILILLISSLMTYLSFRYSNNLPSFLGGTQFQNLPVSEKENVFAFLWAFILLDVPVFASVFFGSPAVSSEIENKTSYHIFSLPIGRFTLLGGKYLAAFAVTLVVTSIYIAFEAAVLGIEFHAFPFPRFYISYGLLILFILSLTSLTFLISSIFSKNLYAYITVFIIYFLVFNVVEILLQLLYSYNAFFLLSNASSIVQRVFINVSTSNFSSAGSITPAGIHEVLTSSFVMLLYTVIGFVAALFVFERR
ncbi:MAG TPA: ABC transporter permease, partial [Thermoplasmataceae archaeon]|nr:ABC transporter permease [Thermoplasmataceae archaeon]